MKYKPTYDHLKCDHCGGTIGIRERNICACGTCNKEFILYKLTYDRLLIWGGAWNHDANLGLRLVKMR